MSPHLEPRYLAGPQATERRQGDERTEPGFSVDEQRPNLLDGGQHHGGFTPAFTGQHHASEGSYGISLSLTAARRTAWR